MGAEFVEHVLDGGPDVPQRAVHLGQYDGQAVLGEPARLGVDQLEERRGQ
ncbi:MULTISPECIES: hypothetical protein [unclassified Streptomyces]|nr:MULTISPECIES: hypothetical protein [unclassified Streptomyces]